MSTDTTVQLALSTMPATSAVRVPASGEPANGDSSKVKSTGYTNMPASTSTVTGKKLPGEENSRQSGSSQDSPEINEEDVSRAIQNLNDYTQNIRRQLEFSVDDVTGRTVIKVMDSETKETIRQIPSEEILTLARTLHDLSDDIGKLLEIRV